MRCRSRAVFRASIITPVSCRCSIISMPIAVKCAKKVEAAGTLRRAQMSPAHAAHRYAPGPPIRSTPHATGCASRSRSTISRQRRQRHCRGRCWQVKRQVAEEASDKYAAARGGTTRHARHPARHAYHAVHAPPPRQMCRRVVAQHVPAHAAARRWHARAAADKPARALPGTRFHAATGAHRQKIIFVCSHHVMRDSEVSAW